MKASKDIVNFLFETGILAKTPRSGFHFLGSGNQTVAEHIHRTSIIGYTLGLMDGKVDTGKILQMCVLHDISESRVSDLNYVHQKYTVRKEDEAVRNLTQSLPFGKDIEQTLKEYHDRKSREALLAKDADNLEFILSLKEQYDIGNKRAKTWIPSAIKRLKTDLAQQLAKQIMKTDSDEWWFTDKKGSWWINREETKKNKQ